MNADTVTRKMYNQKMMHKQKMFMNKYTFPIPRIKNIVCHFCNKAFELLDRYTVLSPLAPLLLSCGHPICSLCALKFTNKIIVCKVCGKKHEYDESESNKLPPVNIFLIGLLRSLETRSLVKKIQTKNEPEFSFQPALESRIEQKLQGRCTDCKFAASCRCIQCENNLFCDNCYMRIHQTALKGHERVDLPDAQKMPVVQVCETHKCYHEYFCIDCDIDGCSHCFIVGHSGSGHKIVHLREKNEDYIDEYNSMEKKATDVFNRLSQSYKTLEETDKSPEDFDNIENSVTQRFIFLHGLLQIAETEILKDLHSYRNDYAQNIEDLKNEILKYRTPLQDALMDVHVIKHTNMERINLRVMIDKLKKLSDVPSCVIKSANDAAEAIKLIHDDSIIEALENQCQVEFSDINSYQLCREKDVPAKYTLPQLPIDNEIQTIINRSMETEMEAEEASPLSPYLSIEVNTECDASSIKDDELESTTDLSPDSSDGFIKSELEVQVLHIENPSNFYVIETRNMESYEKLQASVQKLGKRSRGKLSESEIDKNTRCIAKDTEGVWHRARVLQVTTNHNLDKLVKVYMYDCGKKFELPISSIKKINSQLESTPVVLIESGLKDIEPVNGSWTENAKLAMIAIINRPGVNLLCIEYSEGPKLIGDIKHMPKDGSIPDSVRQSMVFNGHGTWIRSDRLQRTNPNSCLRKLFHEDLTLQNFVSVHCTYIEDVCTMYVQKTEQVNVDFLKNLEFQLHKECNTTDKSFQIHVPEIGMLCAVPAGPGGVWARARITGLPGKKMVEMFLIDFGISRRVQCDSIRRLPARFMTSRTQAIKIQVKGVKPISAKASAKATKYLVKHILKQELSVIAYEKLEVNSENNENNFYRCTVYVGNDDNKINLGQLLEQAKFVAYEGTELPLKTIPEQFLEAELCDNQTEQTNLLCLTNGDSKDSNMLNVGQKKKKASKKEDPFKIEVQIVKAESPDCIYVSEISRQKEFAKLKYDMHEYYKNKKCIVEEGFKKDDPCAAYSPKDKTHLRGKVVDVLPTEKVVVFFYDLAITEELDMDYLHYLRDDFAAFPLYSFRVKLAGISPCGGGKNIWSQTTNDKLEEKIQANLNSKFFIVKIGATDDNDTIPVELTMQRNKIVGPLLPTRIETESINKYLVDEGVALPAKGSEADQIKTLAIELKKELVMHQPTANDHRWSKSKLIRQIGQGDEDDSDDDCSLEVCTQLTEIPIPPENTDWLPPVDIEFDQFEAIPTNIDYNAVVYFHLSEQKSNLDLIKRTIDKTYKNAFQEPCDLVWRIGEVCMVRYKHDRSWYRGRIVGQKTFYYEVYFIDYGNTEIVSIDDLKKRVILLDMPAQATACEVHGLVPVNQKFSTNELDMIHQTMVNRKSIFVVILKSNDKMICSINMKKKGKLCNLVNHVVEELKIPLGCPRSLEQNGQSSFSMSSNDSFASDSNELKTEEDDDPDVVIEKYNMASEKLSIDGDETDDISEDEVKLEYKELELQNLLDTDTLQVEITSLTSCTEFITHLLANQHSKVLSQIFKEYTEIMSDLENVAEFQPMMTSVRIGLPCCAKYTDDKWYRAKIINILPDQENCFVVHYVDFGNEYPCPNEWLREINAKWLQVPPLAVYCKLWNISYSKNADRNDTFIKRLSDLVENRALYAKVKTAVGNQIKAEFYTDKKCVNLVYATLIEDGFLRFNYSFN